MRLRQLFELDRTGEGSTAVVGWGRGMGHKGHMMLASSVITYADKLKGDPYFVVSRTYGPDDPLQPEEKLAIYKRVFPDSSHIFQTATDELPDLTRVLSNLNQQGYNNVTVVVGADQKQAFQYLKQYNGKPNKAGNIPFKFDNLDVIARQETGDPSAGEEGPRATPMRQVLMDPTKSEQEQFAVWRDAMSPEIDDAQVMDLMRKAKERMGQFAAAKPKKKAKEMRFIEFINKPKRNYVRESLIQELFPALAIGAGLGALGKHYYDKYKGGDKPSGKAPSDGSSRLEPQGGGNNAPSSRSSRPEPQGGGNNAPSNRSSRPEPRGGGNSSYWTYSVPNTTDSDYDYDPDSQEKDKHGHLAFQYDPNPSSHNSRENVAKAVAAGRRMPPNVYPPDAKPHPINPEIAYYKDGRWWDYPSGEPWSDTSPALQSRDYYTTRYSDQYGQKRGAYRNVKINPVAVSTNLPKGDGNPEFEKIQDNFGNHVLPVGKYDFKGNSICVWYKPAGGRNQMYTDLSRVAIAGEDSLRQGWEDHGYQMQGQSDIEKIQNDLGPGIIHTSILKKNGAMGDTFVAAHYISKVAFKYQGKPAMSYVQVTHFGSSQVWKAGGRQAFYNVIKGLSLGQGLEPLDVVDANIQYRQFPRESKNNKAKQMRLYELDQPSGTLYIIFKLNPRTEQVNVIGDFATFPEEVVQRSQNVGIRDKKGGKGRPLRVNFQFQDASSALGELEDAIRDVDFIGGEAAELVFPLSAMRSEFGEELHELKSLIAGGADERFKLYKGKDAGSEPDTKPKGVDHFVVGPDGKRRRVPIPGKPNSQMGGQAVAQPNVFKYTLLEPGLMPKLRDMGYKFDGNQIILRADQRDKLKKMLGDKFGQVFGSKGMFKQ